MSSKQFKMESVKSARPITSRPLSSARGMVNTGLTAPKSSRGRTALRRQVQDKSYFLGILRSKINEINTEKNVLLRESEIMSKEEARIGVYRQKAETLAKELDDYSLELAAYNEFLERIRIGDDAEALLEDTNQMKRENEALVATVSEPRSLFRLPLHSVFILSSRVTLPNYASTRILARRTMRRFRRLAK